MKGSQVYEDGEGCETNCQLLNLKNALIQVLNVCFWLFKYDNIYTIYVYVYRDTRWMRERVLVALQCERLFKREKNPKQQQQI